MLKEKGKIILIIVLVIQLITPFTFLIYQNNFNKHLEEPDEYIKLNIDSICFEYENRFTIYFDESYSIEYDNYFYEYVYFEPSKNNEYSEIKFSENKPEINEYLEFYKFDNLMCYEVDDPYNIYEKHGYLKLYDKYNELENIARGFYNAPLTEAYALIGIYKNEYKIIEIYIGGYTLEEYVKLYEANEIDLLRYHNYNWGIDFTKEDYLKIIPENKRDLYYLILNQTEVTEVF